LICIYIKHIQKKRKKKKKAKKEKERKEKDPPRKTNVHAQREHLHDPSIGVLQVLAFDTALCHTQVN
jgi:hypothetical protein